MKHSVYLAGPMTGYDKFNFPAFDFWCEWLENAGHEVFSPADNDRILLNKTVLWTPGDGDHDGEWKKWTIDGAPDLRKMLGDDLQWIAQNATAIAMMPGWEKSSGANAEWALAKALGLKIFYLYDQNESVVGEDYKGCNCKCQ
jgi:hypothetical protein